MLTFRTHYIEGDRIFYYNEDTAEIEKRRIKKVLITGKRNNVQVSYVMCGIGQHQVEPTTISEAELLLVSSKERSPLADYINLQLENKIKKLDMRLEERREEIQEVKSEKKYVEKAISKLQTIKRKRKCQKKQDPLLVMVQNFSSMTRRQQLS